ncbi:MAG: hypothetical protein M0R06_11485 [Sphaerochaeta sp.]|jgi:hypothetical protein|nr:hypothetical protein [Sphaerochaeta sp.]
MIDEVLLTIQEEINCRCHDGCGLLDIEKLKKAQCLKLLEWLIKERLIVHENYSEFKDYEKHFKNWHKADCRVCELESKLKEG